MGKYQREKLKSKNKAKWPEGWVEPSTGKELGIDENDLWIAAQAIERNLVLASQDSMARLLDVAAELRIEDWTSNPA